MVRTFTGWSIRNILEFLFTTLHQKTAAKNCSHSDKSYPKGHNPSVSSATGLDFQTSNQGGRGLHLTSLQIPEVKDLTHASHVGFLSGQEKRGICGRMFIPGEVKENTH